MLEGDPDEHPVYCAHCGNDCNNVDEPFMYGEGDFPYCSEGCAEEDGALDGTVE